jgi:hypothetical protein
MCDPVTAIAGAGLVLGVGKAVVEHKAQNKASETNKQLALESLKLQDHELSVEEVQAKLAGQQQDVQADQEVQAAQGDISTSAASRGVGGASIDLLLNDAQAQGARFKTSVGTNTDAQVGALDRQKDAALDEAKARIAGVPKASLIETGLKIGGSVLDAATLKIARTNRAKGA